MTTHTVRISRGGWDNKTVVAHFIAETNTLALVTRKKGAAVVTFSNEVIDSGALVRLLPEGYVVLPLNSTRFPNIERSLESAGIVALLDETWSTWGGERYGAARVLIKPSTN